MPDEYLYRLDTWLDIVDKQKSLLPNLDQELSGGNKQAVWEICSIIVELSYMVKDDLQDVMCEIETGRSKEVKVIH
jgi:hypothetical protein